MTKQVGILATALAAAIQTSRPAQGQLGGKQTVFVRDVWDGDAAQNDTVSLGLVPYEAILDPVGSVIFFDDMGTSITLDLGDATHTNTLVAAADVATAAGSVSALKAVDIINHGFPLWKMLGYTTNPGGNCELLATLAGGNPAAGTLAWQIIGHLPGA